MQKKAESQPATFGKSRSVRLPKEWYRLPGAFYFITVCTERREVFFHNTSISNSVITIWREAAMRYGYHLWGMVVMPDHFHALLQSGNGSKTLGDFIRAAKTLSQGNLWKQGVASFRWQRNYHDHILRDGENPIDEIRYMLDNPVRKGLVQDWREWPAMYLDPEVGLSELR